MGAEWDVRRWKSEIDREVKCVGLNIWKNGGMERKSTLEWYEEKEVLTYESGMMVAWVAS